MLDTIVRAGKGALRSPTRTLIVVLVLAVGLSFALTSVALALAAEDELEKIEQTTGVEAVLTVNPAQFQAAITAALEEAGGDPSQLDRSAIDDAIDPLTDDHAQAIEDLAYVRNSAGISTQAVSYSMPGEEEEPEEQPAEDVPASGGPGIFGGAAGADAILTGTDDASFLADFRAGTKVLVEGQLFDSADSTSDVVVIDQNTATEQDISVGDTVVLEAAGGGSEEEEDAEPLTIEAEVIGIYEDLETASAGGFGFAQVSWYAPLSLTRQIQDVEQAETLSSVYIVVDTAEDLEILKSEVGDIADPDLYTLTTTEAQLQAIAGPVETMRNTSVLVMFVGLGVVGVIMVLMMALAMRARLREIGILKAIGAKTRHIISQFALETVGIAIAAVVIAVPSVVALNTFVPDLLRPSAEAEAAEVTGGPGFGGLRGGGTAASIGDPVRTEEIEAALNEIDASVSPEVIGAAVLAAMGLGLLGSAVTVVTVMRLRPAEVLRMEG